MARPVGRKRLSIVVPARTTATPRRYACRDCPARCCKNWGVTISTDEAERIARDPEAVRRLADDAPSILARGLLPMVERDRELVCVFLDGDDLCSLHKRHGHAFLPRACQSYPFGFSSDEQDAPVALLSRYCPSIERNYGAPLSEVLEEKLALADPAPAMSARMGLRSGRTLPLTQYVALVELWRKRLASARDLRQTLLALFALTEATDAALPADHGPTDEEFRLILDDLPEPPPAFQARRSSFGARILVAHLLGAICYPLRVLAPFSAQKSTLRKRLAALWLRFQWLFSVGKVRLLLLDRPVALARLRAVESCLAGEHSPLIAEYLSEVLARRQGMRRQTYLHRFLIELGLMAVVTSQYARACAAARGDVRVTEDDVHQGLGIAELLLSHQGQMGQSLVLDQLRLQLISNPDDFAALLHAQS